MEYQFTKVRQSFDSSRIADVEQSTAEAVTRKLDSGSPRIPAGARIAIAAGSRGIANIDRVVKTIAAVLKGRGAHPFIVPAMGSHGGSTAEGQAEILASYGITEESVGCPIRSSMEVVELENGGLEMPLFMDRHAF